MGYTHYWKTKGGITLDYVKFHTFQEGVKQIIEIAIDAGIDLEVDSSPANYVSFNGPNELGHESFIFEKTLEEFNFCKTAGKPYDMAVVAVLIHAKKIFGDDITIKSDGNWDDWEGGRFLYETTFGVEPQEEEVFA